MKGKNKQKSTNMNGLLITEIFSIFQYIVEGCVIYVWVKYIKFFNYKFVFC